MTALKRTSMACIEALVTTQFQTATREVLLMAQLRNQLENHKGKPRCVIITVMKG
jgi:hypothetical protein